MDILFTGKSLSDNELVESDSILQGNHCENTVIFLKHPKQSGHWIKVDPKTVKQVK